jgi:lysophospholipase L1-like esterase
MKKLLVPIFISLAVFSFVAVSGCKNKPAPNQEAGIISRGQPDEIDRFEDEIKQFEEADKTNIPPQGAVLFAGSSSIRLWSTLQQDFAPLPVINRGFGGSTIPEVIYYAERIIYKYQPSIIVFYCGENDMAENDAPPVVFQNFKKFMGETEKKLPNTTVVVISAKPSPQRWNLWRSFQQYNSMVEQFAKNRPRLRFINISEQLMGADGHPDASLFVEDKLHLNSSGYERWTNVLKPILNELYGSKLEK